MRKTVYNYRISDEAELDIEEAYLWYESQRAGLGEEFFTCLDVAKKAILNNAKTYRIRYKNQVRSFLVDRFPYMILYIVSENYIDVISVFNTNQHPSKWKSRV